MCVIVYVPEGHRSGFQTKYIDPIMSHNRDGFGMMWGEGNKIKTIKGLYDRDEIEYMINDGPLNKVAYHFRYTTVGSKTDDMCHPFQIADDMALMHNGTFSEYFGRRNSNASDTYHFTEDLKKVYKKKGSNFFFSDPFMSLNIGSNKVLIMGMLKGQLHTTFLNKAMWSKKDGMIVSNTYSFYSNGNYRFDWEDDEDDKASYYNRIFNKNWKYSKYYDLKDDVIDVDLEDDNNLLLLEDHRKTANAKK